MKKSVRKRIEWIPFTKNGSLIDTSDYPADKITDELRCRLESQGTVYKPNFVFEAVLFFQKFEFGRSAQRAIFADAEGRNFSMPLHEFERLLKESRLAGTMLEGKWTFGKKGTAVYMIEAR